MGFKRRSMVLLVVLGAVLVAPTAALAQENGISTGDTAWVLMSAALVLLMTPALSLFYAGMVRKKNILSTMAMGFTVMAAVSLQWVLLGYSLAFGPDVGGLIGNLDWAGLAGVGQEANDTYSASIPHLAFMFFQATFAIITVALIVGTVVERVKFSSFIIFGLLWTTFVYDAIAHWVWADGGWLASLGTLDFAGGTVVHISSGVSALALAFVLGRRRGFRKESMEPSNIPLVVLGTGLLWFGWFGFNAGSALTADGLAANAFVVTNTAAAAGALTWLGLHWRKGRPSVLGAAAGAVAGLVAITPAAGFVGPISAIVIGAGSGFLCYYAVALRMRLNIDETLDVWGIHGVGGTWGALATGIFASKLINPDGANGLIFGDATQLSVQFIAVAVTWAYAFAATFVLAKAVDLVFGLRVGHKEEGVGLDISQHGERAYAPR